MMRRDLARQRIPLQFARMIDQAAEAFELELRSGKEPAIETYLPTVDDRCALHLFEELLPLELAYLRKRGVIRTADDYLKRWPQFRDVIVRAMNGAAMEPSIQLAGEDFENDVIDGPLSRIPERIGPYRVIASLGHGGQGTILRAAHAEIGVEVVIKVAHAICGDDADAKSRFVREAATLAGLRHPSLPRIFGAEEYAGRPCLIMEHIPGRNLAQYLQGRTISPWKSANIVADIAEAVAVAHRHGIIHQDIKPENVLITLDGTPCLIDFGLSRCRNAWRDNIEEGTVEGTLQFMAPEQAQGNANQIGVQTDIFALGGLLYHLLSGGRALRDGQTISSILDQAAAGEPVLDAFPNNAPRSLRKICRKAMSPDPRDRYPDAETLALAIRRARHSKMWCYLAACVLSGCLACAAAFVFLPPNVASDAPSEAPQTAQPVNKEAVQPRLDINHATAEELGALPGIGEILAQRIVGYRDQHGPFRDLNSLANVEGIGEERLKAIAPHVEFSPE